MQCVKLGLDSKCGKNAIKDILEALGIHKDSILGNVTKLSIF